MAYKFFLQGFFGSDLPPVPIKQNLWSTNKVRQKIFLVICFLFSGIDAQASSKETKEACEALQLKYSARNYMSKDMKATYCTLKCKFVGDIDCSVNEPALSVFENKDAQAALEKAKQFFFDPQFSREGVSRGFKFNLDTDFAAFWQLFVIVLPASTAIFPVILSNSLVVRGSSWTLNMMLCGVYILLSLFLAPGWHVKFHNVMIGVMCATGSLKASSAIDVTGGILMIFGLLCAAVITTNLFFQLGIGIMACCVFMMCFYRTVTSKDSSVRTNAVIYVVQFVVVLGFLEQVLSQMVMVNGITGSINFFVSIVGPLGQSGFALDNVLLATQRLVFGVGLWPSALPYAVLSVYFLAGVVFLLVRSMVGVFVLRTVSHESKLGMLVQLTKGLYIYTVDVFHPWVAAWRLLWHPYSKENSSKTLQYVVINLLFFVCEFFYAQEILLIRFFISFIDWMFIGSTCSNATSFLSDGISLSSSAPFATNGALPYISGNQVSTVTKNVVEFITVRSDGSSTRASGFLSLHTNGSVQLCTVNHAVRGARKICLRGKEVGVKDFHIYHTGVGSDPAVVVRFRNLSIEVAECGLVSGNVDINDVSNVMLFIPTPDDCMILASGSFSIMGDGCLSLTAGNYFGDSGSPCFAVNKAGALTLWGVVSKGEPSLGRGNIISRFNNVHMAYDSSESDDDSASPGVSVTWDVGPRMTARTLKLKEYMSGISDLENMLAQRIDDVESEINVFPSVLKKKKKKKKKDPSPNEEEQEDDEEEQYKAEGGHYVPPVGSRSRVKGKNKGAATRKRAFFERKLKSFVPSASDVREEVLAAYDAAKVYDFNRLRSSELCINTYIGHVPKHISGVPGLSIVDDDVSSSSGEGGEG